jgi:ribonuclease HI
LKSRPTAKTLEDLLRELGITKWDLILVGDGSGSTWQREAGWAVTALEKTRMERKVFYGAMNCATSQIAEIMAYVHPLLWYVDHCSTAHKMRMRHAHVITDSSYVRNQGEKDYRNPGCHELLWSSLSMMSRLGIDLHWHWIPRQSAALNVYADALAGAARKLLKDNCQISEIASTRQITPDNSNPWE